MTGDIFLFYPSKKWVSLYVAGELGGVVHSSIELSEIVIDDILIDKLLIEANSGWKKVVILPLSTRKGAMYDIYRLRQEYKPAFNLKESVRWALKQVGRPYDFWQILGIKLHKPLGKPNEYICSEFVLKFYRAGGILLCRDKREELVVPPDFARDYQLEKVGEGVV